MGFLFWATSSKLAAYILTICIAVAVSMDPPQNIQAGLLVVISVYYQGVALPALGAASKRAEDAAQKEGQETRKLLKETHDTTQAQLQTLHEAVEEIKRMHAEQRESYAGRDATLAQILAQKEESDAERDAKLDRILALLQARGHRR